MEQTERIRVCPCGNRLKPNQGKYCSVRCKGRYHQSTTTSYFGIDLAPNLSERVGPGLQAYLRGEKLARNVAHTNKEEQGA